MNKTMRFGRLGLVLLALLSFTISSGCASLSGSSYKASQTRSAARTQEGVIVALRPVTISDDPSSTGALVGAAAGGILGSLVGGGNARIVSAVAGAGLGALAGTGLETAMTSNRDALEITVKDKHGDLLTVVQEIGPAEKTFAVGQEIYIHHNGADTRIAPKN